MIPGLFLTWSFTVLLFTANALRRPPGPGHRFPPLWLAGMVVSELAPWVLAVHVLVGAGFLAIGGLDHTIGRLGLVLFLLSAAGLTGVVGRTLRAVREAGQNPHLRDLFSLRRPVPGGAPPRTVPYAAGYTLDLYGGDHYRAGSDAHAPALVYVHPGSWMRGRPGRQALALFDELVERGWVVVDIRYPLSPAATFPDHLVGVKAAISWMKEQAGELGIDPARVAVAGGSAGAHLAALAALTWDLPGLQPGFEDADTSVAACVAHYGIYDLLIRNGTRPDWPFIARHVMKAQRGEAPDLYRLGSPIDQVRPDAPPFLVLHGSLDSVVLAAESTHFVDALRRAGGDVRYHEVHGAQHGFDAIASPRTRAVARLAAGFLTEVVAPDPSTRP